MRNTSPIFILFIIVAVIISCNSRQRTVRSIPQWNGYINTFPTIKSPNIIQVEKPNIEVYVKRKYRDTSRFDVKRINSALDKIDRIGDMQELFIRSQQGYFRMADSARIRALKIKEKDSTIKMLLAIRDSIDARDRRQLEVNRQILKNQSDSSQARAYSKMFEKTMTFCAFFVLIVVIVHFLIYLFKK